MSQTWKKRGYWILQLGGMLVVLIHLGLPPGAGATGPQEYISMTMDAMSAILNDPQLQGADKEVERKQRVRRIIHETFDFADMARVSLGTHWDRLTAQQQEEFTSLFGHLFEVSYQSLVLKFLPGRQTSYNTESIEKDRAVVRTTLVVPKTEAKLPVNYQLVSDGQRWAVFDVVVDGVSIAGNYRAQFDKVLRSSTFETLVQRIKRKLEQESS